MQGSNAPVGYYPWQAALFYDGDFFCGGALIDETHVLSAAHCFQSLNVLDTSKFMVVLGDNNIELDEGMIHLSLEFLYVFISYLILIG